MAWADTLQEASFDGMVFDIIKTDDDAQHATAEHSYPYVDGADIEDMGRGARRVHVEAVFFGEDYETRLQWFISLLDQRGSSELVHPVFGSIKNAQVSHYNIRHDAENPDFASVTIEFIESTPGNPFFARSLPVQKAEAIAQHGAAATASASEAAASVIDRLRAANPLAGLDTLRQNMMAPLLQIASTATLVLSGLDVLAYPRAWGNDIAALAGSFVDVREWGSRLTADWASIQSDLHSFSMFGSHSSPAPAAITSSTPPTEAQATDAVATTIQINVAVALANAASFVLASEADTPTLQPGEIESISNTARTAIDDTIEQARLTYGIELSRTITEPLKDQGLAVQEAARSIIETRPPLIQRTVDAPANMRLLAHLFYADHTRAEELYRLNGGRSPFVNTGDRVNAYAN